MTEDEEVMEAVRETLNGDPLGMFHCPATGDTGTAEDRHVQVQVQTSLLYPGGGPISVYVRPGRYGCIVTDQGTAMNLLNRHLPTAAGQSGRWTPTARKICEGLEIAIHEEEWTVQARTPEDVGRAGMTLAQALLRMSIVAPIFKIINEG